MRDEASPLHFRRIIDAGFAAFPPALAPPCARPHSILRAMLLPARFSLISAWPLRLRAQHFDGGPTPVMGDGLFMPIFLRFLAGASRPPPARRACCCRWADGCLAGQMRAATALFDDIAAAALLPRACRRRPPPGPRAAPIIWRTSGARRGMLLSGILAARHYYMGSRTDDAAAFGHISAHGEDIAGRLCPPRGSLLRALSLLRRAAIHIRSGGAMPAHPFSAMPAIFAADDATSMGMPRLPVCALMPTSRPLAKARGSALAQQYHSSLGTPLAT